MSREKSTLVLNARKTIYFFCRIDLSLMKLVRGDRGKQLLT